MCMGRAQGAALQRAGHTPQAVGRWCASALEGEREDSQVGTCIALARASVSLFQSFEMKLLNTIVS